jgi:hypothetical protein
MTADRSRWFRCSLRTLFVLVTAVACWLAYYIHWKNERREARAWMHAQDIGGSIGFGPEPRPDLPCMLRLLGERPEKVLIMADGGSQRNSEPAPPDYRRLVEKVASLFPEAQIVDLTGPDSYAAVADSASDEEDESSEQRADAQP